MRNTIFNIIIIIVFFSCNHHNKSNTDYQNNKSAKSKDLEKAMIIGKTDNLKAFEYFNIINKSSLSLKLNNYYDEINNWRLINIED